MGFKIHCINNISADGLKVLPENFQITDEENTDAWIIRSVNLHEKEFPENLLAIGRAGSGVNNIPLDRCTKEGIVVFNAPGANANSVKELVIGQMIALSRHTFEAFSWVNEHAGEEGLEVLTEKAKKQYAGAELAGKVMGVVGLGQVGYHVANACADMGMKVLGYDPMIKVDSAWKISSQVIHCKTAAEILGKSDFISVHVPLNGSTKNLLSVKDFERMKKGIIVINYARTGIVDEKALAPYLESGRVAAYLCDFPNAFNTKMKNSYFTPHLGASTKQAEDNCAAMVSNQIADYLLNGNITNSVNCPSLNLGSVEEGLSRICVLHKNVPGLINYVSEEIATQSTNIDKMSSASKDDIAYAIFDINGSWHKGHLDKLKHHKDILKLRIINREDQ